MVARIAPEPVNTSVAVADYRVSRGSADLRASSPLEESPLPPVPAPVPTPVPTPAVQPPSQAFDAAVASESLAPGTGDALAALRRLTDRWAPPASSLNLTDRLV